MVFGYIYDPAKGDPDGGITAKRLIRSEAHVPCYVERLLGEEFNWKSLL